MDKFLIPQWPSPERVRAISTTRTGGVSRRPYDGLNLGVHVGDSPEAVRENRRLLESALGLPGSPVWLNQVHGTDVIYVDRATAGVQTADAAWTDQPGCVLSVMTADCLPVLLASKSGDVVAVAHGGWRGLVNGILQKTVAALPVRTDEILAWLGPAIGPSKFEVGAEVRDAFVNIDSAFAACFQLSAQSTDKFFADIFRIGQHCLHDAGVTGVFGGGVCTFERQESYFSHRRDQGNTGRMASLLWMDHRIS